MLSSKPLVYSLPTPVAVSNRLGDALREVRLLQRLMKLAELAEQYREYDRHLAANQAVTNGNDSATK